MKPLHLIEKQFYVSQYSTLHEITEETVFAEIVEATYNEDGEKLTERHLSDGVPTLEQYMEFFTPNDEGVAFAKKQSVPTVVSMRQARLALLEADLLSTIETAIQNGLDEAMKIEWEYATEVRRDWESLIAMATSLGMTDADLDNLFILAGTL